tara:strand:+ start:2521 stop:2745 length:225 start_codon:yes stop_codon:yes gene_type:complete
MISNNESELVKQIINFSEHIADYGDERQLKEVHERLSFCIENFCFWEELGRKERSIQSLKDFLSWLIDTAENKF